MAISKNQGAKEYGQQMGKSKGKETLPSFRNESGPVLSKGFAANHTAITVCRKGEIISEQQERKNQEELKEDPSKQRGMMESFPYMRREKEALSVTSQNQNRQAQDPDELARTLSPILATMEEITHTRQPLCQDVDNYRLMGPIGSLAVEERRIEAPLPKNLPNRENWPTSHKSRCVDGGISEEIVSEASRAEIEEGIEGNVSNKERNGRCAISEAEEGAALDMVFMDVDPFRLSKGGNPNFCSDHKTPAEPETAENLVKPPLLTVTNSADPKRVSQANVYGGDSGEQYSFVQEAAYSQGFMEVEPACGYPISDNVFSSPISQPSLRRQKT
ncbi:hypothetical protein U1Q18_048876 [Sarracenia purpurea var. burkii]